MVSLDSTNFQKIQSQNFQIFVRLITQKMQKLDKIPKISKKNAKYPTKNLALQAIIASIFKVDILKNYKQKIQFHF